MLEVIPQVIGYLPPKPGSWSRRSANY